MKLKKAIREHAQAVDALAWATIRKNELEDLGWHDEAIETDLVYARKEYKRTQRQIKAVMAAMQYRGRFKIAYEQPVLPATKRDEIYVYIARLAWEPEEIRDKMLSLCSAYIKDEVEEGARSGTWYSRTLGWRSNAEVYANGVLASAVSERYPLDSYAELNVPMFSQKWEDKHFVSIVANGTIEECISIDEHANCDG